MNAPDFPILRIKEICDNSSQGFNFFVGIGLVGADKNVEIDWKIHSQIQVLDIVGSDPQVNFCWCLVQARYKNYLLYLLKLHLKYSSRFISVSTRFSKILRSKYGKITELSRKGQNCIFSLITYTLTHILICKL